MTQKDLAFRSRIFQPRISGIEKGEILPTLPQIIRLAQALTVPVQWFLNGLVMPGTEYSDYALELQWLGVVDLFVPDAAVPGAFRPPEQILALAVSGNQPDPRIIEALPAVLAWNRWSPSVLRAYARPRQSRTSIRLAWLADIALTIHRTTGFPGGCPYRKNLETLVRQWSKAKPTLINDDLGCPGDQSLLPPASKRWKIRYDAHLTVFVERAKHLNSQRQSI